ncbi:MAG: type II toxin-antitoxin system RelE/ParE family toxin [Campylobacteraceae bacterium]|nr:type II toxin-antitoxin system RelE/ParE family toxin [Campylobacteraceae bacterium]
MNWIVKFKESAKKELSKLDKSESKKIISFLEKLSTQSNPRQNGKSLKGKLKEYWRYRVGDYRILCKIQDDELVVLILKVAHRKDVYE